MRVVTYQMSELMAATILKERKGDELKMKKQDYLCYWINTHNRLIYPCTKVEVI